MDTANIPADRSTRLKLFVVLPLLVAGLLWASWPTVHGMMVRWSDDPRYSHGFLVPAFSAYLLWHRRAMLQAQVLKSSFWGLPLILLGAAIKLAGDRYYIDWLDAASILPLLAGLGLLLGGWPALRWSWPAILFLIFMIPLPYRAEAALGAPLQRFATISSNYLLQTLGLPAVAEGNVILINDAKIGVVDACNGMGMLFMFGAFSVAVALLVRRDMFDKFLILLSAVPIALLANVARITLTGFLHETAGHGVAETVYHDLAGWLMMPFALAVLWVELWILSHLFLEMEATPQLSMAFVPGGRPSTARQSPRMKRDEAS